MVRKNSCPANSRLPVRKTAARATRFVAQLRANVSGNVMPMMAVALIPAMGLIGSGIDFGRNYLAASKLQGAVDAAALAAVRAKQIDGASNSSAIDAAETYLAANFPNGYMGAVLQAPVITITDIDDVITASVDYNGTVPTTLLGVVGVGTLDLAVTATARASEDLPTAVEALLVLDNTGSMEGSRMSQLKSASKNFVDIIYGNKNTRKNFAVGILPYNTMVNTGHLVSSHNSSYVNDRPGFTDISPSSALGWKGCLTANETVQNISSDRFTMDSGAFDIGKDMPGEAGMPAFEPFIYPPIKVESFQDVDNFYKVDPSDHDDFYDIPAIRKALVNLHGDNICVDRGSRVNRDCSQSNTVISFDRLPNKSKYKNARFYSHKSGKSTNASPNNQWGPSPNYQCPAQALPISYDSTKSGLKSYIDDENAALRPGTGTFHNPAMAWAYRMMARDDVFPRNRPTSVPTRKVVIFMTDGNFDSRDDGRKESGKTIRDTAYTAYGTYEDRKIITTTDRDDTIEHLSRRFAKTCEAMKADGIEIYTIAFALNTDSSGNKTRVMFQDCSTNKNTHFFNAANGNQLSDAFTTIAAELIDLRLTN